MTDKPDVPPTKKPSGATRPQVPKPPTRNLGPVPPSPQVRPTPIPPDRPAPTQVDKPRSSTAPRPELPPAPEPIPPSSDPATPDREELVQVAQEPTPERVGAILERLGQLDEGQLERLRQDMGAPSAESREELAKIVRQRLEVPQVGPTKLDVPPEPDVEGVASPITAEPTEPKEELKPPTPAPEPGQRSPQSEARHGERVRRVLDLLREVKPRGSAGWETTDPGQGEFTPEFAQEIAGLLDHASTDDLYRLYRHLNLVETSPHQAGLLKQVWSKVQEREAKQDARQRQSKQEPSAVVARPLPPTQGHTGTDTLGRRWLDGELLEGDWEPLDLPPPKGQELDITKPLSLSRLLGVAGEVPDLSREQLDDLNKLGVTVLGKDSTTEPRPLYAYPRESKQAGSDAVGRLIRSGILELQYPDKPDYLAYRVSPQGLLAIAKSLKLKGDEPPTTLRAINFLKHVLETTIDIQFHRNLLAHFGIDHTPPMSNFEPVQLPDERWGIQNRSSGSVVYRSSIKEERDKHLTDLTTGEVRDHVRGLTRDLHGKLLDAAHRYHNPEHVASRVRNARELHPELDHFARVDLDRRDERERLEGRINVLEADLAARGPSLDSISKAKDWNGMLYDLLDERRPEESISETSRRLFGDLSKELSQLGVVDWTDLKRLHNHLVDILEEERELSDRLGELSHKGSYQHHIVSSHLRRLTTNPGKIRYLHSPDTEDRVLEVFGQGMALLEGGVQEYSPNVPFPEVTLFKDSKDKRAYYYHPTKRINFRSRDRDYVTTAIHEWVHAFDHSDPGIAAAVHEFWKYRVGDEAPTNLQQKFPGSKYKPDEEGRRDRFDLAFGDTSSAYYCGKVYPNGATEVLTMGVQQLFEDPSGFARKDPEYFTFVLGILTGRGGVRPKPIPWE